MAEQAFMMGEKVIQKGVHKPQVMTVVEVSGDDITCEWTEGSRKDKRTYRKAFKADLLEHRGSSPKGEPKEAIRGRAPAH